MTPQRRRTFNNTGLVTAFPQADRNTRSELPKNVARLSRGWREFAVVQHTIFASNHPMRRATSRVSKIPAIYPGFPAIRARQRDHGFTARTVDRAVLIELRQFLAGIHTIWETTPDKREVGSSSVPRQPHL